MSNTRHRRDPKPIPIGRAEFGLSKLGASRFDLRDPYHLAVSLSWPGFAVAMLSCWLVINLVFALLYWLRPGDVANIAPDSFADVFFFSIETLATVGYGVMAPATLYGHIVSAAEIVTGMAFTAIFTGLLFVRFSRPKAKSPTCRSSSCPGRSCTCSMMKVRCTPTMSRLLLRRTSGCS
jgi:inward rectifier potassium channel